MSLKEAPDQQKKNWRIKTGISLASEQCNPEFNCRWKANDSLRITTQICFKKKKILQSTKWSWGNNPGTNEALIKAQKFTEPLLFCSSANNSKTLTRTSERPQHLMHCSICVRQCKHCQHELHTWHQCWPCRMHSEHTGENLSSTTTWGKGHRST